MPRSTSSEVGSAARNTRLEVTVTRRAVIEPSQLLVTTSQPAQLTCHVTPPLAAGDIVWFKDGRRLPAAASRPALQLTGGNRSVAGMYQCHVTDDLATAQVRIGALPARLLLSLVQQTVQPVVDTAVTFTCAATASPPPAVTWTRDGVSVDQLGGRFQFSRRAPRLRRRAAHPPSGGADGCLSPPTIAEIGGREYGYSADKGVDEPLRRAAPHSVTAPARDGGFGELTERVLGGQCRGARQHPRGEGGAAPSYRLHVFAVNRHGCSEPSGALRVHTEPEPPGGPPLGARLRPAGPRTLRLTWSPPPPQSLTHGRITYVRLADQITLTRSVRRPELVLLLKHLRPNTAYSVTMSACNRAGQCPAGSPVTATTEEGVPEVAPRQLTCRAVSPSSIGLS
ncbi:Down syndrome cell adhesion molecule-like protein Dscam2 [Amphibalanus amphitrite]|uniref:Down syndrome cell adhesion molecule-like protein Dscam2 n=1 Tax=Amphibalanus amphitrite TaxID=1232801 RepID=A0A6A4WE24_AMPAM|nr:Down syndrome cell adhesion molecule-like protein Dscam2 [Amphibalanus amphitrite]